MNDEPRTDDITAPEGSDGGAEQPAAPAASPEAEPVGDKAAAPVMDTSAEPVTGAGAEAGGETERKDLLPEQRRLTDLAARYPEIGPPLAELAFKIGEREWAERLVRMGLDQPTPGVEFYAVTANAARREGRHDDAFAATLAAARRFAAMAATAADREEGARLLALVRQGFASLMFDLQDVRAQPAFVHGLAEVLPALEPRLQADPLYHVILAQLLWYEDATRSEAAWERATAADDAEMAWNARGTWYKEAAADVERAEATYRQGLARAPRSALLLHNLAQLLLEKAVRPDIDVDATRQLVREAETLLRQGLRCEAPRGLRRFIHSTLERLDAVRASLPPRVGGRERGRDHDRDRGRDRDRDRPRGRGAASPEAAAPPAAPPPPPPEPGAVLTGRVAALTHFGAFVSLGGHRGLLHKSEMAHQPVADPATFAKIGDEIEVKVLGVEERGGQLRISLSRRALLPAAAAPPPAPADAQPAGPAPAGPAATAPRDRRPRDLGPRDDRGRDGRSRDEGRRDEGRPPRDRDPRRGERDQRSAAERATDAKLVRLGEILLAKLKGNLPER